MVYNFNRGKQNSNIGENSDTLIKINAVHQKPCFDSPFPWHIEVEGGKQKQKHVSGQNWATDRCSFRSVLKIKISKDKMSNLFLRNGGWGVIKSIHYRLKCNYENCISNDRKMMMIIMHIHIFI